MKKVIQWMMAAILICGATAFTSCGSDGDDENNPPVQPDDNGANSDDKDNILCVDLSKVSGDTFEVTEDVVITGTPAASNFSILYQGSGYEVTLDNVNLTGAKQVFIIGNGHHVNLKLAGKSRLKSITASETTSVTIGEAEPGGMVTIISELMPLFASTVTINGGTVKAKCSGDLVISYTVWGNLVVNGGAVYLAGGAYSSPVPGEADAVNGSVSGSVNIYGWFDDVFQWAQYSTNRVYRYVTTDVNSGNPANWSW